MFEGAGERGIGSGGERNVKICLYRWDRVTPRAFGFLRAQILCPAWVQYVSVSNMHQCCNCISFFFLPEFNYDPRLRKKCWVLDLTSYVNRRAYLFVHTSLNHWQQLEAFWVTWEKAASRSLQDSEQAARAGGQYAQASVARVISARRQCVLQPVSYHRARPGGDSQHDSTVHLLQNLHGNCVSHLLQTMLIHTDYDITTPGKTNTRNKV